MSGGSGHAETSMIYTIWIIEQETTKQTVVRNCLGYITHQARFSRLSESFHFSCKGLRGSNTSLLLRTISLTRVIGVIKRRARTDDGIIKLDEHGWKNQLGAPTRIILPKFRATAEKERGQAKEKCKQTTTPIRWGSFVSAPAAVTWGRSGIQSKSLDYK